MEIVEFCLSDRRWREQYDQLFESCPCAFIQQSTAWAEIIGDLGPDQPIFLLLIEEGIALAGLPLYLYRGRRGPILTSVPQPGPLGGIFTSPKLSTDYRQRAYYNLLQHALTLADRLGCLTLSMITNPFADDRPLYDACLGPTLVLENYTQFVPLDRTVKRSNGQHKGVIRAEQFGFRVEPTTSPADLSRWYEIHVCRHTEVGAKPIDFRHFENILRILAPHEKGMLLLAWAGDELAAGTFYIQHRQVFDVFLASMNVSFASQKPNALLVDRSMAIARSRGATIYNWQSSPGRSSGVYEHKRRWGSEEASYAFVTCLFDRGDSLRDVSSEELAAEYAGHYVIPFQALASGLERRRYYKA